MEELSLDNILTGSEIENLFVDDNTSQESVPEDTGKKKEDKPEEGEEKKEKETTEVNVDSLFTEPGSVGSGDTEEKEDTDPDKGGTSPKFYSSIAKAFAEEGIFPDLDEEAISKVETPEDFRDLVEQQIKAGLDERQKRIDDALNAGVEPNVVRQYESTINYLDSIKEDNITAETEEGENLRKQLIYQDFINRGYSKERASKEVKKSLDGGTDIDDAKEALNGNKEYFRDKYDELVAEAKKEEEAEIAERKKQAEELKTSILNDKKVFGEIELDKATRQKVYDNLAKPVYKDPDTGEAFTAIQRYEMEHKIEFLKNLSLVFTLTDGFKTLDRLVNGRVKKEVKKGFKELENTLNNTARTSDGNLNYTSGVDSESFISKGWIVDA